MSAAVGLDRQKDRREDVDIVVAVLALKHARQPLEAHAGINVLGRKRLQLAGFGPGELDDDEVPQLDHALVAGVDERTAGAIRAVVVMDLAARAAGAGGAHFPEVVLLAPSADAIGRHVALPDRLGFGVRLQVLALVTGEDGDVQAVLVQLPDVGQQLPCPLDGLGLEVVAKRPVAEHLEERVVVVVLADILEVVVFASGPDALLAVGDPAAVAARLSRVSAQHVLELVHPRVDEEQRGVVMGDDGAAGHVRVAVLLDEVIDEPLADLCRRQRGSRTRGDRSGHQPKFSGRCVSPGAWWTGWRAPARPAVTL